MKRLKIEWNIWLNNFNVKIYRPTYKLHFN